MTEKLTTMIRSANNAFSSMPLEAMEPSGMVAAFGDFSQLVNRFKEISELFIEERIGMSEIRNSADLSLYVNNLKRLDQYITRRHAALLREYMALESMRARVGCTQSYRSNMVC